MHAFICQCCITLENRVFFMEKLKLHSLKTGLVSQFLSKTYNPRKICKYPSTTDPQCGEASSTYASLNKYCPCMMFLYISFNWVQRFIIYSSPHLLLSHFISGDSDNRSYKFSKFHIWWSVTISFLTLQQS